MCPSTEGAAPERHRLCQRHLQDGGLPRLLHLLHHGEACRVREGASLGLLCPQCPFNSSSAFLPSPTHVRWRRMSGWWTTP